MPARHDNHYSLKNAAKAITELFPQVQSMRVKQGSAGPTPLPIFLNGVPSNISHSQSNVMHQAIDKLVEEASSQKRMNIRPFFYPRWTRSRHSNRMAMITHMAHIAQSDFHHVPAVFGFKVAREQYLEFIKEYFLWA